MELKRINEARNWEHVKHPFNRTAYGIETPLATGDLCLVALLIAPLMELKRISHAGYAS